jgi:hypothetical protein
MVDQYLHDHKKIIKVFKGSCIGVVLEHREDWENPNDPHVCFFLIVEDDGNWFESSTGIASSYWLPETIEQLNLALEWMQEYCHKDPGGGWEYAD